MANNKKINNQSNIFGILSIIAGVVSLFTAGVAGLVGVVLGIVGLVKNEKKKSLLDRNSSFLCILDYINFIFRWSNIRPLNT